MRDLQIIHKNNKPHGIRDDSGFLFFFTDVKRYTEQEERYITEVEDQHRLADYLLKSLKTYSIENTEVKSDTI